MKCDEHNHNPSFNLAGHPSCRRLTEEAIESVNKMIEAVVPARQVLTSLHQEDAACLAIDRTIYNAKSKRRRVILDSKTPIQALMDELEYDKFYRTLECSYDGSVKRLYFAHVDSVALA